MDRDASRDRSQSDAETKTDGPGSRAASLALGLSDAFFGILAVSGVVEEVEEGFGQMMAVVVILLL